jgi:hypothetical protein
MRTPTNGPMQKDTLHNPVIKPRRESGEIFSCLSQDNSVSKTEQHTSETQVKTVVVNIPSANPLMNLPAKNN